MSAPELKSLRSSLIETLIKSKTEELQIIYEPLVKNLLDSIMNIRQVNGEKILNLTTALKNIKGQKYVYYFYQKDVIPTPRRLITPEGAITKKTSDQINLEMPTFHSNFETKWYELENWDINFPIDPEKIKQAFSDPSITFNLIYFTKPQKDIMVLQRENSTLRGIKLQQQSSRILVNFKKFAKMTGGISEVANNPHTSFKRVADKSESYYLLYYSPQNKATNGEFRKIEVKIKNGSYKISHREGYRAN